MYLGDCMFSLPICALQMLPFSIVGSSSQLGSSAPQPDSPCEAEVPLLGLDDKRTCRASWAVTVAMLLSLQLGWGLWLTPADFAR